MKGTLSEPEIVAWGEKIGRAARAPMVIVLRGDLGAGKTTLARAIARGAGVERSIPSPTYNLLFRYPAADGREIVHIDLYRLEEEDEVWALGWGELPAPHEIVLIEWGERAERLLPRPRWEIALRDSEGGEARTLTIRAVGEPSELQALPGFE